MRNEILAAASHGGRYANAAVLLILALFAFFMSYAVSQRASLPVPTHENDDALEHRDHEGRSEWIEAERRRAQRARVLQPALVVIGCALLVAAALAAWITSL